MNRGSQQIEHLLAIIGANGLYTRLTLLNVITCAFLNDTRI
jgi:hypothetical protein